MASAVRERLKAEGAIGFETYPVSVLRRMDLGPESCRDLLHCVPGRVGVPRRNQSGTCFFLAGLQRALVVAKSLNSYRKNGTSVVTREERSKTTGQSA